MAKNKRQAYAVSAKAGYDTAAESWCTGRAVARIPRAPGGGTHRAGQAAFGNQARGGGMFNPTRIWRRWHRRVNVTKKRHAVAVALAASSLPPLVMARGHKIGKVAELPLVVSDGLESVTKTKQAVESLKKLGCGEELQKVLDSKKIRAGKGKARNRRFVRRLGPLVIYNEDGQKSLSPLDNGIVRAMRNVPGVETAHVDRLNLLRLAPGGAFGRFLIFTESAFKRLSAIYGTRKGGAPLKKGYTLPRAAMANADLARIINSTEVQSVLRPKIEPPTFSKKRNALKSKEVMEELNPGSAERKAKAGKSSEKGTAEFNEVQKQKKARIEESKKYNKTNKKGDDTFYKTLMKAFEARAAADAAKKAAEKKEAEGEDCTRMARGMTRSELLRRCEVLPPGAEMHGPPIPPGHRPPFDYGPGPPPHFDGRGPPPPFMGGPPPPYRPPFERPPPGWLDARRPPFDMPPGARPPFEGGPPPHLPPFERPPGPFDARPPFEGGRPPFEAPPGDWFGGKALGCIGLGGQRGRPRSSC
ncbi:RPL4A [Symbiodinium sp. CCMP2592]|nr:RPL4A [Symbiodinium sp. CCMP2592]